MLHAHATMHVLRGTQSCLDMLYRANRAREGRISGGAESADSHDPVTSCDSLHCNGFFFSLSNGVCGERCLRVTMCN
jgi:hypothetical protein